MRCQKNQPFFVGKKILVFFFSRESCWGRKGAMGFRVRQKSLSRDWVTGANESRFDIYDNRIKTIYLMASNIRQFILIFFSTKKHLIPFLCCFLLFLYITTIIDKNPIPKGGIPSASPTITPSEVEPIRKRLVDRERRVRNEEEELNALEVWSEFGWSWVPLKWFGWWFFKHFFFEVSTPPNFWGRFELNLTQIVSKGLKAPTRIDLILVDGRNPPETSWWWENLPLCTYFFYISGG